MTTGERSNASKLAAVRAAMAKRGVRAVVVPSQDPHFRRVGEANANVRIEARRRARRERLTIGRGRVFVGSAVSTWRRASSATMVERFHGVGGHGGGDGRGGVVVDGWAVFRAG